MKYCVFFLLTFSLTSASAQSRAQTKRQYWDSVTLAKLTIERTFINLQPTDVIADVGTGIGYSLIPLAASCPACKISGEDIDSSRFNPRNIAKRIALNGNKVDPANISYTYGTEQSTRLPPDTYTKVLLFDVLHEMTYKNEMLADIKRIMKPQGSLFIEEILVHKPAKKNKKCNYRFLTEPEFETAIAASPFRVIRSTMVLDQGKNTYIKLFECVSKLPE